MSSWQPNLNTQNLIQQFVDRLLTDLPYKLGIDEIIPGCQVIDSDVDSVGIDTFPRLMEVALRDQEYYFAVARGNVDLSNGDYCTVVHLRDGDIYEILTAGGSTGSAAPATALQHVTGVTRTVGIGQQHATLQDAIDWFDGKAGDGKISLVTVGTYNAQHVMNNPFMHLEIEGDTRDIVGLGYVDGAQCNQVGIANAGTGIVTLANAGNVITVTMTGANPAFDTAGLTNQDQVLIYDNAGTWVEYNVSAVLNNTITLTVAAPAVGNDATTLIILPNRRLITTVANSVCMLVTDTPRLTLDGVYIYPLLATSTGVQLTGYGNVVLENVAINAERCIYVIGDSLGSQPTVEARSGAISLADGIYGILLQWGALARCRYIVIVDCTAGMSATMGSFIGAEDAIIVESNQAYYAYWSSTIYAEDAWARQNTTAYYAAARSYIWALNTNANNNGNIVNYSPAVSDAWGNRNASISWT